MKETYTTKEIAVATKFSLRYVQKSAKELGIKKTKGSYILSKEDAERLTRYITQENEDAETVTQEYTVDQYNRLEKILKEHDTIRIEKNYLQEQIKFLENQLEYSRKSLDRKHVETERILSTFEAMIKTTSERNTLEFIDKTKDKD